MKLQAPSFVIAYGAPAHSGPVLRFAFIGQELVLGVDLRFPAPADGPPAISAPCAETLVFGMLDGIPCQMMVWPAETALPDELVKVNGRALWGHWMQAQLDALSRARQLAGWLHQNRFCGVCGQAMQTRTDEPACVCTGCQHQAYPRISPVCIGLVLKGDQILLARSPHFPPGIYSALAGFVEAGESAEQCLRREVMEEAGIEIDHIRWFGSQSWPYPHSLMMGFIADYAAGELCPQADEIEDLRWFDKSDLPALPDPASIAYQMIQAVLAKGRLD